MKDIIVEADVMIDFLSGVGGASEALSSANEEGLLGVSAVSAAEVLAAAGEHERVTLNALGRFRIIPIWEEVAFLAGKYFSGGGRDKPELGDCLVAATAQELGAVLLTKGARRYPGGDFEIRKVESR